MSEEVQPGEAAKPTARELLLQRLKKLNIQPDERIPYRLESVFANTSGWGGNGEIKRRAKLQKLVEPKLADMLLPKEEVLYVAKGVQYSLAESYLMGALIASMLNQTVFVLTNLRLLMLRSSGSGKPQETCWVIYYSEIAKFKPSWTGVLSLKLQDRQSFTFSGFSRRDRKAMPAIFEEAIEQYERLGFEPSVSQSRENLCSHCYHVVPKDEYLCAHCGAEYWRPRDLALRSLIFPSWGDICMKHYGVAAFEMFGYVCSWLYAAHALSGPDTTGALLIVALIFVFEHPVDAVATYFVARKGLNPRHGPDPDRVDQDRVDQDRVDPDRVDQDSDDDDVEELDDIEELD